MPYDEKRLRGVGNHPLHPIGVCTARVQLSDYLVTVSFVILALCSHHIILSFDFLREHSALIFCRTGELAISPFPFPGCWKDEVNRNFSGSLSL